MYKTPNIHVCLSVEADLGEGPRGGPFSCILKITLRFCFENRFNEMLFHSIFRNVNVTLLCVTNTPTILYVACPEK